MTINSFVLAFVPTQSYFIQVCKDYCCTLHAPQSYLFIILWVFQFIPFFMNL